MREFTEETCVAKSSKYIVQCTPRGRTVYFYDSNGNELAEFKDMKHTHQALISNDESHFVLRSLCGTIGVYSTEERTLIKKIRYGSDGQDGNFCFSNDGKKLYLIESVLRKGAMYARLISYDIDCYVEKHVEFERNDVQLVGVAPTENNDELLVVGYKRNGEGLGILNFVALIKDNEISDIRYFKELACALTLVDWTSLDFKKINDFYSALPVPRSPFMPVLNIYDEWNFVERLDILRDAILQYDEVVKAPRFLRSGENGKIFEFEREKAIQRVYDALSAMNDFISSVESEFVCEGISSDVPIKDIYNKCQILLNYIYGL